MTLNTDSHTVPSQITDFRFLVVADCDRYIVKLRHFSRTENKNFKSWTIEVSPQQYVKRK